MAQIGAAGEAGELKSLLGKVLEVETAFESLAEWEGYIKTKDVDLAALVLRLYSESSHHESLVRSLMRMAGIEGQVAEPSGVQSPFSMNGSSEREIAESILKMEVKAHSLYGQILEIVTRHGSEALLLKGSSAQFVSTVEMLRRAENEHIKSVEEFIRSH